jgi:flagellar hook assembly protein FlgD
MRTGKSFILFVFIVFGILIAVSSVSFLSILAKIAPHTLKIIPRSSCISVTVTIVMPKDDDQSLLLPNAFLLSQNYPNPFNSQTVIKYELPNDCHVELTVYNLLGQKVKILVSDHQGAGYKTVYWDSRNDKGQEVASGIYVYRLRAGEFTDTKKMVLSK